MTDDTQNMFTVPKCEIQMAFKTVLTVDDDIVSVEIVESVSHGVRQAVNIASVIDGTVMCCDASWHIKAWTFFGYSSRIFPVIAPKEKIPCMEDRIS